MKYSIIEDIFYGRRGQVDSMKLNKKRRDLNKRCIEYYDSLQKTLNNRQKEQLENLLDAETDDEDERTFACFKEGLKIGLLLICECLED